MHTVAREWPDGNRAAAAAQLPWRHVMVLLDRLDDPESATPTVTADRMTTALPVSEVPRPGESIESWLEPLDDANSLTTAQLVTAARRGRGGARYVTLAPSPETVARPAALARVNEEAVRATTLARFDGTALDLTGLDPHDRRVRPDLAMDPQRPRAHRHLSRLGGPAAHRRAAGALSPVRPVSNKRAAARAQLRPHQACVSRDVGAVGYLHGIRKDPP